MICCISRDKQNREFRRLDRARQDGGLEVDPLSKEESIRLLHEYEVPFEDTFPLTNKRIPIIFFDTDKFTIERINNSKGYFPGNVKWATRREQANNTKRNKCITINSWTLTIAQWAQFTGIGYGIVYGRFRRGWPPEKAIFTPVKHQRASLL